MKKEGRTEKEFEDEMTEKFSNLAKDFKQRFKKVSEPLAEIPRRNPC